MSSSNLLPRLTALARSWPKDPIRPAQHLQLGHAISKNLAQRDYDALDAPAREYAERAVSALESIRDGNESKEHPLASHMLAPKSDPEYYTRLRRAIEKVERDGKLEDFTFAQKVKIFFGAKPSSLIG